VCAVVEDTVGHRVPPTMRSGEQEFAHRATLRLREHVAPVARFAASDKQHCRCETTATQDHRPPDGRSEAARQKIYLTHCGLEVAHTLSSLAIGEIRDSGEARAGDWFRQRNRASVDYCLGDAAVVSRPGPVGREAARLDRRRSDRATRGGEQKEAIARRV
jgi:hypothetical protein